MQHVCPGRGKPPVFFFFLLFLRFPHFFFSAEAFSLSWCFFTQAEVLNIEYVHSAKLVILASLDKDHLNASLNNWLGCNDLWGMQAIQWFLKLEKIKLRYSVTPCQQDIKGNQCFNLDLILSCYCVKVTNEDNRFWMWSNTEWEQCSLQP